MACQKLILKNFWEEPKIKHFPVLLNESIKALSVKKSRNYVDCTFGRGGHSKKILSLLSTGKLTSFDLDHESEKSAAEIKNSNFNFIRANFSEISSFFQNSSLDGAIIDCGVSSPQIDQPERGFSFQKDGPLDMRFGDSISKKCYDVVNFYSEKNLVKIFKQFGEEKKSN